MSKEYRSTDEVLKEKYEERGWDQDIHINSKTVAREQIKPLPLSKEEYEKFCLLLAKLALEDDNPNLCETYFELQRRAYYGNGYQPIEEMSKIEQEMWNLGTGEKTEGKHIR